MTDGTVRALDLRQIKVSKDDYGLMTYDPAFDNTASTSSAITYIDGERGILGHRGYSIEELASAATSSNQPTCSSSASCPPRRSSDEWRFELTYHTLVHEDIGHLLEAFRYDATRWGCCSPARSRAVGVLPRCRSQIDDPEDPH